MTAIKNYKFSKFLFVPLNKFFLYILNHEYDETILEGESPIMN